MTATLPAAPPVSAAETTRPIPRFGMPVVTYCEGDRVTCQFVVAGRCKLFIGTVTETDSLMFTVAWDNHPGVGRFAHGHEPSDMRFAHPSDERILTSEPGRRLAAQLIREVARERRTWPAEIRATLLARAARLDGGEKR